MINRAETDAAIAQYQRALEVDPNLADAHSELATALLTKGDSQKAEAHYLEAARLDPKRADVHSNLGSLLLGQGKTSQAIIQYEEALRIDPTLTEAEKIFGWRNRAIPAQIASAEIIFPSHIPPYLDDAWRDEPLNLAVLDARDWGTQLRFSAPPPLVEKFC